MLHQDLAIFCLFILHYFLSVRRALRFTPLLILFGSDRSLFKNIPDLGKSGFHNQLWWFSCWKVAHSSGHHTNVYIFHNFTISFFTICLKPMTITDWTASLSPIQSISESPELAIYAHCSLEDVGCMKNAWCTQTFVGI